ncbi:MAG: ABC transporter permease [Kiritimatiellae bacterium]|jgi:spermidine/putrescine transport system permease protein|nr:ABC transporter permease [Kiritimatiellia bacterium]MDD3439848.1 ABC transporter permease [Kiritimatiellia bacterium]MDD4117215.1 ABC transporter permease [Kiritimatiellia bacterium]
MKAGARTRLAEWLVTLPSFVWLGVLFLVPTVLVFAITFKPATPFGGIGEGWTLDTLRTLGNPNYPAILWRTIRLSMLATGGCILLATPMAYYMARAGAAWRRWLLLLVVLPFWTSSLVRIFAWKVLLHPEGMLKQALVWLGLAGPDAMLLYNENAVLLVMVYTELPFAILPIYAAAEKFDFRLIEAAKDLGASSFRAFRSVFLPGIRVGLLTAFLMVFIPSLGSYVIPDIVGGPTSEMVGNKIAQRTFVDRNLPHAAGLSAILAVAVLAPLLAIASLRRRESPRDALREEGV